MNKLLSTILNVIFFSLVIIIAISVSTIALAKKVNDQRRDYYNGIKATVIKQDIPIVALTEGYVKKLYIREGQEVDKNELLLEIDNPVLKGKIDALEEYPDNVSAQTESRVAKEEIKRLKIYSPVRGFISDLKVAEGSPVDNFSEVMIIYSNENVQLLADLSDTQYQKALQMKEIDAYSVRLNQNFAVEPDILRPNKQGGEYDDKTVGLFLRFKDLNEAKSLLTNEDLELRLSSGDEKVKKPVDYFVDFWNGFLLNEED